MLTANHINQRHLFPTVPDQKFNKIDENFSQEENFEFPQYLSASEVNRVTMKIDVSHTDHSHLIGKGGQSVKAMMLDTQCHIHFPDSNRTNNLEKSNQVSISGSPVDVERARQRIRKMLPLVYSFTLPNQPPHAMTLYRCSPIVSQCESKLPVEISYRHHFNCASSEHAYMSTPDSPLTSSIVVSIRGIVLNAQHIMEATNFMLENHFGKLAKQQTVCLKLEVESKHQSFILHNYTTQNLIDVIFEATGAKVRFPDYSKSASSILLDQRLNTQDTYRRCFYAPRLSHAKTNSPINADYKFRQDYQTMIAITGSVHSVFLARQFIMNLLPVMLISEISNEEGNLLERLDCSNLKNSYDVLISFRTKHGLPMKQSMVIKTSEVNVSSMFYVLNHLTCITRQRVTRSRYTSSTNLPTVSPIISMWSQLSKQPEFLSKHENSSTSRSITNQPLRKMYPILGRIHRTENLPESVGNDQNLLQAIHIQKKFDSWHDEITTKHYNYINNTFKYEDKIKKAAALTMKSDNEEAYSNQSHQLDDVKLNASEPLTVNFDITNRFQNTYNSSDGRYISHERSLLKETNSYSNINYDNCEHSPRSNGYLTKLTLKQNISFEADPIVNTDEKASPNQQKFVGNPNDYIPSQDTIWTDSTFQNAQIPDENIAKLWGIKNDDIWGEISNSNNNGCL